MDRCSFFMVILSSFIGCQLQLISYAEGKMLIDNDKDFLICVVPHCAPHFGYLRNMNVIKCINEATKSMNVWFMEYARLGNSELKVSRICMGCMGFGIPEAGQHSWTMDEKHSREIIKHSLEHGINFFDTCYSLSERNKWTVCWKSKAYRNF